MRLEQRRALVGREPRPLGSPPRWSCSTSGLLTLRHTSGGKNCATVAPVRMTLLIALVLGPFWTNVRELSCGTSSIGADVTPRNVHTRSRVASGRSTSSL